jgi:hypothetical protein
VTRGCGAAADCREEQGEACGWYGGEFPDVPDEFADDPAGYLADGTPLPEPPEDEVEPEPWDPQPIRVEEIPVPLPDVEEYDPIPLTVEERAARVARWERARRVHVAERPRDGLYRRLGGEFDPRGRHVGCDGDPETGERGCGRPPGEACQQQRGRFVPGFVHPTRLRRERDMFGLTESTVTG